MSEPQDDVFTEKRPRSGGPQTEEGKLISRMNALKHGLRAKVLGEELPGMEVDEAGYQELLQSMIDHYQPKSPVEEMLVRRIALLDWRLQRIAMAEKKSLYAGSGVIYSLPPVGAMERILKYERTMDRELHRTITLLERLRRGAFKTQGEIDRDVQDEQDGGE